MAQDLKIIKAYVFVRFYVFLKLDVSLLLFIERKSSLELIIGGVKIFVKVHPQQDSCQTCESIGAYTEASGETEVFVSVSESNIVMQLETWGVLGFRLQ